MTRPPQYQGKTTVPHLRAKEKGNHPRAKKFTKGGHSDGHKGACKLRQIPPSQSPQSAKDSGEERVRVIILPPFAIHAKHIAPLVEAFHSDLAHTTYELRIAKPTSLPHIAGSEGLVGDNCQYDG